MGNRILRKFCLFLFVFAVVCASSTGCNGIKNQDETFTDTSVVMDTVLKQTLYGKRDRTDEIRTLLVNLERKELSWREPASEVNGVNEAFSSSKSVGVTPDFANWTEETLKVAKDSNGALDPTIGELIRLWDIEGDNPKVPDRDRVSSILKETGYQQIKTDNGTLSMGKQGMLDFGAVGKGIGADEIKKYLSQKKDVSGAVVAIGGSVLVYGKKPGDAPWKVAVQDPRAEDGTPMGVLSLSKTTTVSTSGDYERYFEQDGVRYHHILDPSTGYPAKSGLISVTIIHENGLYSDGLSTACFVLGKDKGMALLEKYGAEGVFIDEEKNVYITDGLKDIFSLMNEEYHLKED